jgi:hypothetical protein
VRFSRSANRSSSSAARRGSTSTARTRAPASRSLAVSTPGPGPISRIRSPARGVASRIRLSRAFGSTRKFCPSRRRGRIPRSSRRARSSDWFRGTRMPLLGRSFRVRRRQAAAGEIKGGASGVNSRRRTDVPWRHGHALDRVVTALSAAAEAPDPAGFLPPVSVLGEAWRGAGEDRAYPRGKLFDYMNGGAGRGRGVRRRAAHRPGAGPGRGRATGRPDLPDGGSARRVRPGDVRPGARDETARGGAASRRISGSGSPGGAGSSRWTS